jgi:hypothetical protein
LAAHHDALEFPDGRIGLLTLLREGQAATVLQLEDRGRSLANKSAQVSSVEVQTALSVPCRGKVEGNKKRGLMRHADIKNSDSVCAPTGYADEQRDQNTVKMWKFGG